MLEITVLFMWPRQIEHYCRPVGPTLGVGWSLMFNTEEDATRMRIDSRQHAGWHCTVGGARIPIQYKQQPSLTCVVSLDWLLQLVVPLLQAQDTYTIAIWAHCLILVPNEEHPGHLNPHSTQSTTIPD
jgi:hypothetical protein